MEVLARQRTTNNEENKSTASYAVAPEVIKSSLAEFKKSGQEKLGQYLLLSHQFFVQRNYTAVLQTTADMQVTEKLSNVDFSYMYLRGLALEKTQQKDKAYTVWQALASKTHTNSMRTQSQIALIINLAENDKLREAFTENSLITFAPIRKPAIIYSANAQVLEYIMQGKHTSTEEKHAALFQLVRKNLQYQQYSEALRIIKLYPLKNYNLSEIYLEDHAQNPSKTPLINDLQQYVDDPKNTLALVNLAGRYETFHLTDMNFGEPKDGQVGNYKAKWAGEFKSPLKIFQQVMQDSTTSEEARAKAISGAINCFRRIGANRCDSQDIPLTQRKIWFATLKKTYGKTTWAQAQKLYW